jgi:hypothetical protein
MTGNIDAFPSNRRELPSNSARPITIVITISYLNVILGDFRRKGAE